MSPTRMLRVSAIRSQNPKGTGGCIFTGRIINETGKIADARSYYVVKASGKLLGETRVQVGQWWQVDGACKMLDREINGFCVTEVQIEAVRLGLLQPSGEHIVIFMAENEDFPGIGLVKARKLWDAFHEDLYSILDSGNVEALSPFLNEDCARQAVTAWAMHGNARTLQWLQSHDFDIAIGRKVLSYFGAQAQQKLEEDPYRLLSFCASWKQVDGLARSHFNVREDDPRRIQGAIEETLYRLFSEGHTVGTMPLLVSRLESLMDGRQSRESIKEAIAGGVNNGSYVVSDDGRIRLLGPHIMEATVARFIAERLNPENNLPLLDSARIAEILSVYETAENICLNEAQSLAIQTAAANAIALILGGAGTGKTTVLKALYEIYDATGIRIFQTALAGRAAKRMVEATGRPATTLASFLKNTKEEDLEGPAVVVIDEASMVDIISMSRLCEMLPGHVRLVLAGDSSQLMPVGPGLVLHALVGIPEIPQVELQVVKRYGGKIAQAALAVRDGDWPELPDDEDAAISFIPCATAEIADRIVDLYKKDTPNTQILSPRRNSLDGTIAINTLCQSRFTRNARPLLLYLEDFDSHAGTGFHLGDLLLCTRNLWDWGLQNGSLGRLVEIEEVPRLLTNDDGVELGHAIGWVLWDDGERRPVVESMLDDLVLGYAVTVHKAQGSQWPRVLVALTGSRMLDRTLIYTALTRAQRQVVLIGDPVASREAVEGLPRANMRNVGLGAVLKQQLMEISSAYGSV